MIVSARVDCGVEMNVHLTLAAREALHLEAGREVWLVIKTHSCHLMQNRKAKVCMEDLLCALRGVLRALYAVKSS